MKLNYYDQNLNRFSINDSVMHYIPIKPSESSSGTYDGGAEKIINLSEEEVEKIQFFIDCLNPNSSPVFQNLKGNSVLNYDGLKYIFKSRSPQQIGLNQILNDIKQAESIAIDHEDYRKQIHEKEIHVLCEGVTDPRNVGMALRLADAFDVRKVTFNQSLINSIDKKIERIARQTNKRINHQFISQSRELLDQYIVKGFFIISIEISTRSVDISKFNFSRFNKYLIIIGSEQTGIPSHSLSQSNVNLHIPMFGQNSSMNVIQSLGIALHSIVK